jgi:hypothetical protein
VLLTALPALAASKEHELSVGYAAADLVIGPEVRWLYGLGDHLSVGASVHDRWLVPWDVRGWDACSVDLALATLPFVPVGEPGASTWTPSVGGGIGVVLSRSLRQDVPWWWHAEAQLAWRSGGRKWGLAFRYGLESDVRGESRGAGGIAFQWFGAPVPTGLLER